MNLDIPRLPWLCLTWSCLALGMVGALLPLLPTTPFLLVAAWAAPKGSPALARWLHSHPLFGPALEAWRTERAVPISAKAMACTLTIGSWLLLWLTDSPLVILVLAGCLFVTVNAYLLSRPSAKAISNKRCRGAFCD